jgi:hypothetical protein
MGVADDLRMFHAALMQRPQKPLALRCRHGHKQPAVCLGIYKDLLPRRRRDHVERVDQRRMLVEPIDRRVVAGSKSDEQVRISVERQTCQKLFQSDRTDLGCSAAGFRQARERMVP